MLYFVTLFDKNYLSRGLVLLKSLENVCKEQFHLFIIGMDEEVCGYFSNIRKNISCLSVDELIEYYPQLNKIRQERTRGEFCWTISSFSIQYILKKYKTDLCIYIDSDICFWSDPKQLIDQMGECSVLITEHNYSCEYDQSGTSGKFCVQFMCFKNNEAGNEVLEWWRKKCEEWCYNRIENGRFGDQKYLDDWESRFDGIVYNCRNIGCGLAPWNCQKYNIILDGKSIFVEDKISKVRKALVFFHFHGLHKLNNDRWSLSSYKLTNDVVILYKIYIRRLRIIESRLPIELRGKEDNIKDLKAKTKIPRCIYGGIKHTFYLFSRISEVERNVIRF